MADLAQVDPVSELPDDVLQAYGFYGTLIEKGVGHSDARRATCVKYPDCEEALRPLWDMDEQLRRAGTTPQPSDSEPMQVIEPPQTVPAPGGFKSICKIGEGGQAEVWLARDLKLDRYVAIKVIKGALRESLRTQQRFRREVEITGKLEHPSIVPVYETGADPDDESGSDTLPYYVMRLFINRHLLRAIIAFHERDDCQADKHVLHALFGFHSSRSAERRQALESALSTLKFDPARPCDMELKDAVEKLLKDIRTGSGGSLHEAIEAHYATGRPALGLRDLLGRFIDVCQAMAYAHSRGVIHRDLKPRNIMLGEFGETLVVDWGLSKIVGRVADMRQSDSGGTVILSPDDSEVETETRVGTVTGTIQYMAPEQAWGRVTELSPASDIYSLGAILFTILTGKAPRDATLSAAREGKVDIPSEVQTLVPRALERVCLKAMSKDPSDRYATASELANDVRKWLADEPVSAWHEPVYTRIRRWVKKHRALVGSCTAASLVCGITLMIMLPQLRDTIQQLKNEQIAKNLLVEQGDKRESELAISNALIEINNHERTGLNLLKLDPERAIAKYEEGLTQALNRWRDYPDHAGLGQAVMRLYQLQAEAYEILENYEQACLCHRQGIEVCLIVLHGQAAPEPPRVASSAGHHSWSRWLDSVRSRVMLQFSTFPSVTDGIGHWDFVHLASSGLFILYHEHEASAVTTAAATPEDVVVLRHLSDAYSNLARVEWALGNLSESYQCMIAGMAFEALMPVTDSQLPDADRPPSPNAPRKHDSAGDSIASESHL